MNRRQAYRQKLRTHLDAWQARIHEMEAQASADLNSDYHDQIKDLKAKRDAAKAKLDQLDSAGKDAVRSGSLSISIERALEEVRRAVSALWAGFK